jgi:hypothetical protein
LHRQIAARQRLLFQTFEAQVVGAPFEQRQFAGEFQRFGDGGQIAAVELILQRFRPGGDNHLFSPAALAPGKRRFYRFRSPLPPPAAGRPQSLR